MDNISGKPSPPESLLSKRKDAIVAHSMAEIGRQLDRWLDHVENHGFNDKFGNDGGGGRVKGGKGKGAGKLGVVQTKKGKHLFPLRERGPVKRARSAEGGSDDHRGDEVVENEDQDEDQPKRARRDHHNDTGLRFACPFAKHAPGKYKKVKTCCGPGWQDVHRVKEHVYRKHSPRGKDASMNACNRCFRCFADAKALKEHQRAKTPCRLRGEGEKEGDREDGATAVDLITENQEELLRMRAKANSSSEEKWRDMYKVIFPGEEVPSPYYDTTEGSAASTTTPASSTGGPEEEEEKEPDMENSRFRDFDECRAFVKREFLRAVRPMLVAEVERAFQVVQTTVAQKASDLVKDFQTKLFRTWQFQEEQSQSFERELELQSLQDAAAYGPGCVSPGAHSRSAKANPPAPEMPEFERIIGSLSDDPALSFLAADGEFHWDSYIDAGAAMGVGMNMGIVGVGIDDCGASSLHDSAYFTSSSLSGGAAGDAISIGGYHLV